MNYRTIGTCSICGGQVTVPLVWMSTVPPVPTCQSCGAQAAFNIPVIPMIPRPQPSTTFTTNTGGNGNG